MGSGRELAAIRDLIRADDDPALKRPRHGDLPDEWSDSLPHELALALASSVLSAEKTMFLAWELGARLPGIARMLADGTLTQSKTGLICEAFQFLSDEDAVRAEALLLPQLTGTTGKTFGQLINLTARIAAQVDPGMAERRRKAAEKHASRVTMFREGSGAAGLSGRDLPADETLAAYANVNARASEYQESGAFADPRMDQLRATAYLDLLNNVPAWERIAYGQLIASEPGAASPSPSSGTGSDEPGTDDPGPDDLGPDDLGPSGPSADGPGPSGPGPGGRGPGTQGSGGSRPGRPGDPHDRNPDDGGIRPDSPAQQAPDPDPDPRQQAPDPDPGPGQDRERGPDRDRPPSPVPAPFRGSSAGQAARPRLPELIFPLATLLGIADRPGEGHGFGVLDPDLCRHLGAIAIRSPHTQLCVTVTDPDGIAIGHGCVRPGKRTRTQRGTPGTPGTAGSSGPPGRPPPLVALPARISLTITAELLSAMLHGTPATPGTSSPQAAMGWALAPQGVTGRTGTTSTTGTTSQAGMPGGMPGKARLPGGHVPVGSHDAPGDPEWCGPWTLILPGGIELAMALEPVPTVGCDHRHESHGYEPNDTLRHLVQVRDYTCTFPPCSRHARDSDFEHAQPYDKGGRTCACNAGARSRKCHRIKQSPGWTVTQPRPGWHEWVTPAGRVYTQAPYQYPV